MSINNPYKYQTPGYFGQLDAQNQNPFSLPIIEVPSGPGSGYDPRGLLPNVSQAPTSLFDPNQYSKFGNMMARGGGFGPYMNSGIQNQIKTPADLEAYNQARLAARNKGIGNMLFALSDAFAGRNVPEGVMARQQTQMGKPTAFQQDYQFLLAQGYTPQEAINLLKKGQTINVGNQGFNDIKTKSYAENREFANSAQDSNISLDTLDDLLNQGVKTGFGQETLTNMQRLGQQIMGDDYKASEIAGQEAFISLSTQMIVPAVKDLGVNPTDKDLEFVVKGSPSLSKSIEGNRLMIAALKLSNARRIDEANFDTQFYSENVNATIFQRDQAFQEHRRNNPQIYSAEPLKQAYADIMAKYSTDADVVNVTSGAPTWTKNQ